MAVSGETFVLETNRRLETLETAVAAQPDGNVTLNLVKTVEARVKAIEDSISKMMTPDKLDLILEAKLTTLKFMDDKKKSSNDFFKKPILESKAVSDVDKLSDAKSHRPFNRKMKNAMEQTRPYARRAMEMLETITEQEITDSSFRDPRLTTKETIIDVYIAKHIIKYQTLRNLEKNSIVTYGQSLMRILKEKHLAN